MRFWRGSAIVEESPFAWQENGAEDRKDKQRETEVRLTDPYHSYQVGSYVLREKKYNDGYYFLSAPQIYLN